MTTVKQIRLSDINEWDILVASSNTATFFQKKEWLEIWMKNFTKEELIIGVYDNDYLIGIAPFILKDNKIQFMGVASVEGGELVSDYGDIIAIKGREKDVWDAILNNPINKYTNTTNKQINNNLAMEQWSNGTMELNFIREDSESLRVLRERGAVEETDTAPYIDLPGTWEEYLNSLDKHNRHEIKRKINKALEAEVSVFNDVKGAMADELFRLMEISHQGKEKFLTDKMKEFFKDIVRCFVPKGSAVLKFLQYEGKLISAVLFFDYNNEYLLYNSGFDPEYLYLSPGLVSKALLIKEAIEKNKKRFDFLRGNEKYKYDLGGKDRKLYKITFNQI